MNKKAVMFILKPINANFNCTLRTFLFYKAITQKLNIRKVAIHKKIFFVLKRRLKIHKTLIKFYNLTFWKFVFKPLIFWFLYYLNSFYLYYYTTIVFVWLRYIFSLLYAPLFFPLKKIFAQKKLFLWFLIHENLSSPYVITVPKQCFLFSRFFLKLNSVKSLFYTLSWDFFSHFSRFKFILHKKLWRRRYRFVFIYARLLRAHLFNTCEVGGWSRIWTKRKFKKYTWKKRKFRKFYGIYSRLFKLWRNRLKTVYYPVRWISKHFYFRRWMYYNRKIIAKRLKSLKKNSKRTRFYIRRSKMNSFFSEFSPQRIRLYFRNKYRRKYSYRLQNRNRKLYAKKKKPLLNLKPSFLLYKRFKYRCNTSCTYSEWLDYFKDNRRRHFQRTL